MRVLRLHPAPPRREIRLASVSSRPGNGSGHRSEILDLLAAGDPPAFAVDDQHRIIFWNRGAERVLGRPAAQALGRFCHDVLAGRDVFGNRYCDPNCAVVRMTRRGESVRGFEIQVPSTPGPDKHLGVTVVTIPGGQTELTTIVHLLAPFDPASRLARALRGHASPGAEPREPSLRAPAPAAPDGAPLTGREKEILAWIAAGLQNKEIANSLAISVPTVRNHVHNILEKIGVHSKLEAVSLAFRRGWVGNGASHSQRSARLPS